MQIHLSPFTVPSGKTQRSCLSGYYSLHNNTRIKSQGCFGILSSLAFQWALRLCNYHQKWQRKLDFKRVGVKIIVQVKRIFESRVNTLNPIFSDYFGFSAHWKANDKRIQKHPLLLNITQNWRCYGPAKQSLLFCVTLCTQKVLLDMISACKLKSFISIFSAPLGPNRKIQVPIIMRIS